MTPSNRKRLGEFLILLLYLLVDGYELWDKSWPLPHFWALTAALVGFIALLFLDGEFHGRQILSYSAVALVGCIIIYFIAPPILPEETETHGWLSPANDPTPPNACDGVPRPPDAMLFIFGRNGVLAAAGQKVAVFTLGSCPIISMQRQRQGLLIDADLFDETGDLAVRIIDNEFHLIKYSYRDRSPDRSTLTVHDKKGDESLYVRFINPNAALVRGRFACGDGTKSTITDTHVIGPTGQIVGANCFTERPKGFWIDKQGYMNF